MAALSRIPRRGGFHGIPPAFLLRRRPPFRRRFLESAALLGCLASFLLIGCASAPTPFVERTEQGKILDMLDMKDYTVSPPPGDDWSVEANPEKGSVTFTREKVRCTGRLLGTTIISVTRNHASGDAPLLDEASEANRFRDREERGMIDSGVKAGQYQLSDVRRETVTLDGRKYYTLRYTQVIPREFLQSDVIMEAVLYIHYPPDFSSRRAFYLFRVGDSNENHPLGSIDTARIEPVIRSFRLK